PWAYRIVAGEHADAVPRVGKVKKEAILAVDRLVGGRRRPGVASPPGFAAAYGADVNPPMIRPVDKIRRGNSVDRPDVTIVVVDDVAGRIPGKGVVGGVDVHAVAVDHRVRIRAKPVSHDGVVVA